MGHAADTARTRPPAIVAALFAPTINPATEAVAAVFYDSEFWHRKFPRLQIITIEDMLSGKRPDIPWGRAPFAKAPVEKQQAEQDTLL